jgi:hypothetical protein
VRTWQAVSALAQKNRACFRLTENRLAHVGEGRDSITSVAADSGGELWIGVRNGLSQRNSELFQQFTLKDGLPEELVTPIYAA